MDSDETLAERALSMEKARKATGATCHATACLTARTLEVVHRKFNKLRALHLKMVAYESVRENHESFIRTALADGDLPSWANDAAEIRRFLKALVHQDGKHDGQPELAD